MQSKYSNSAVNLLKQSAALGVTQLECSAISSAKSPCREISYTTNLPIANSGLQTSHTVESLDTNKLLQLQTSQSVESSVISYIAIHSIENTATLSVTLSSVQLLYKSPYREYRVTNKLSCREFSYVTSHPIEVQYRAQTSHPVRIITLSYSCKIIYRQQNN